MTKGAPLPPMICPAAPAAAADREADHQGGNTAATAKTNASATQTVVNTLTAQQQSLSGVSINEETINLMQQQQAFQAAARVVSTVQAMYATLINAMGGV